MFLRRSAHRSLATVLFTDIVDSTDLAARLGDRRWRALLARHHSIVRQLLRRHGGREIDNSGDGFFATFAHPTDAVRCAAEIVVGLRPLEIRVRAGLHSGETEVLGRKVAGIAVVIGSRVMAAAAADEVLVSRTVHDLVAGSELVFEPVGARSLKGVPGTWELFRLAIDEAAGQVALEPEATDRTTVERRRRPWPSTSRSLLLIAGAAVVLLGGGLIGAQLIGRPTLGPNLVVVFGRDLNPAAAASVRGPERVEFDGMNLWVTSPEDGRVLSWFNPASPTDVGSLGGVPLSALAVGHDYVWTADAFVSRLARINPRTAQREDLLTDVPPMRELVTGGEWLWGIHSIDGTVIRLDPEQRTPPLEIALSAEGLVTPVAIASGGDRIWVSAESATGTYQVYWMEFTETGFRADSAFTLRSPPGPLSHDGELLWVLGAEADTVNVVGAARGAVPRLLSEVGVCDRPSAIDAYGGEAWVACRRTGEIIRLRRDGTILARRTIPAVPTDVVVVDGRGWVTLRFD